jgi:FdhE protein
MRPLLVALDIEHPEWRPLLTLVDAALREADRSCWSRFVSAPGGDGAGGRPLLEGAVVTIESRPIRRWIEHILVAAAAAGTEVQPLAGAIDAGRLEPSSLFEAAVAHDGDRFDDIARVQPDYRGVLRGLAHLIAMPMLRACERAWASRVPASWTEGYCPICGGWPAFAEDGPDARRRLRCSRCGSGWRTAERRCPFCDEDDDGNVVSLMSPETLERQCIDVCERCGGYLKVLTTVGPIPGEQVVLVDLATLELDTAAIERGYRRPASNGHAITLRHRAPWRALLRT